MKSLWRCWITGIAIVTDRALFWTLLVIIATAFIFEWNLFPGAIVYLAIFAIIVLPLLAGLGAERSKRKP
jgi:hypothetical protein